MSFWTKKPKKSSDWDLWGNFDYHELDLFERYEWFNFKNRRIVLHGEIDYDICNIVSQQLMVLGDWNNKPIYIILNSVGGSVSHGLLIVETIEDLVERGVEVDIEVRGEASSMGLDILLSGNIRAARPYSSFLLHEMTPEMVFNDKITIVEDKFKETKRINEMLAIRVARRTELSLKEVHNLMDRKDYFFGVKKALEMGFIDEIRGVENVEDITWDG